MIYSTFVEAVLEKRVNNLVDKSGVIAKTMVDIYTAVSENLTVEK